MTSTYSSQTLERLREHREAIRNVLARYGASNPRLFGSIAQGTAGPDSDVDLLLDLAAEGSGRQLDFVVRQGHFEVSAGERLVTDPDLRLRRVGPGMVAGYSDA